jgi:hypothetical protein
MTKITFVLASHSVTPETQVVEIWAGGKFVACLYPEGPDSVKLISRHLLEDKCQGDVVAHAHLFRFKV